MSRVRALLDALDMQLNMAVQVRAEELGTASRCEGWTVRQVLNHSLGVTHKFADFATGSTDEPHAPPGDLIGQDHRAAMRRGVDHAQAAWRSADMTRTCHLRFGNFPAEIAAGINLFDVLAHTWDIAEAIEVDLDEDISLWAAGLDAARELVGPARDPLHYAAEISLPSTAPAMHRFLAFLGRPVLRP